MQQILECIDAGSEFCPCYLAETGDCLMCSQLQGKNFCDCRNWKGVCIYQEYVWNQNRIKEGRKSLECRVLNVEVIAENVIVLTIQVTRTMARELNQPGAYVFLRDPQDPFYFDTPMSIMLADEEKGTIDLAIQIRGTKTKSLEFVKDKIIVRGPYWNGLLGLKYIKGLKKSRALLVVRGIAQAPAVPVAKKLLLAGNEVVVVLDEGRTVVKFAERHFQDLGCQLIEKNLLHSKQLSIPKETLEFLEQYIKENDIQLVYSGGSDKLHEGINHLLTRLDKKIFFTCSNDAKICCGEGICGSCHTRLSDGSRIKTCKTQLSPTNVFKGRS